MPWRDGGTATRGRAVVHPMTPPGTDMAERYERARGLFEDGEYQAAAEALATLVDESALAPPVHGTTELRLLLARSYYHSAQLGRAERVIPTCRHAATVPTRDRSNFQYSSSTANCRLRPRRPMSMLPLLQERCDET